MGSPLKPKSTRARRGLSVQVPPRPQRKPTRSANALGPRRRPVNIRAVAVETSQANRGALQNRLRQLQARLSQICSTAIVVAHALRKQHVELDDDAADVLRGHVSDPLFKEILRLKRIVAGGAS